MTLSEHDAYITAIDDMGNRIIDDAKYPVVKENKIKQRCKYSLEISKLIITYLELYIYASEKAKFGVLCTKTLCWKKGCGDSSKSSLEPNPKQHENQKTKNKTLRRICGFSLKDGFFGVH